MKDEQKSKSQLVVELQALRQQVARQESWIAECARDEEARRQVENALRESEAKYRTLVENTNEAIYVAQAERIVFANPQTEKLYGYSAQELASRPFVDFIHEKDQNMVLDRHKKRLEGEKLPTTYPFRIVDKAGDTRWVELTVAPFSWENRPATLCIQTDITERVRTEAVRRQVEEALRESNRRLEETLAELQDAQAQMMQQERLAAVGQLAAGIAHDFRNLLTTITLYAQIGLRQPNLPPKLVRNIEVIISESKRAADLVQQILDFSSHSMLRIRVQDLASLVQNIMGILKRTIPENVRFSLDVEPVEQPAAFMVRVDSGRVQQVLANLATNARDAMPEGGELRLVLSHVTVTADQAPPVADMEPGAWVCLTASDTGTGMTDEVSEHLFEPFFTTKEVGQGTGLGLAQVYGIVRQHEGFIDAETELGQGTTFRIYLPAYEAEDAMLVDSNQKK